MSKGDLKDRNVAAVLAFFLGTFGVHRFYLGQVGLGVLYCLFTFTGISTILGFIDAMAFLASDEDKFDKKYNWKYLAKQEQEESFERNRRRRERDVEHWERRQRHQAPKVSLDKEREMERFKRVQQSKENMQRVATLKEEGIRFFKDYDYEAAIEAFKQVIAVDEKDVATHFNLACAYSLEENTERSLYHLDKAVAFGFTDTKKIKTHDALAFLRIQPEFLAFEQNQFRLATNASPQNSNTKKSNSLEDEFSNAMDSQQGQPDLLDQLQRLGDLRERGLLDQDEFLREKKRLLG